jgi:Zn-dependent peptidase ImmA (M78 family)
MQIKALVNSLCEKCGSRSPFEIANQKSIIVLHERLGSVQGYYNRCCRQKFIHINSDIPDYRSKVVCAHELGHAILHPQANTPFLRNYTWYSIGKYEREANQFAAELICSDEELSEYRGCSISELSCAFGIDEELIKYKFSV